MSPKSGRTLLVALSLFSLIACRTTRPPVITNCIGDGFGGCDGYDRSGRAISPGPSQLKNWWMAPQPEFAEFAAWCYNAKVDEAIRVLEQAAKDKTSIKDIQKVYFTPQKQEPIKSK